MKKTRMVCLAGVITAAALSFPEPFTAIAAGTDSGALLDQFRVENVPNSGVLVDVNVVGDNILGVVCQPSGIILQADQTFLVTDLHNKVVWRIDGTSSEIFAGDISTPDLSGEPMGGSLDGDAAIALFGEPWAIAPFKDGYAVSDSANHVIRYIEGGKVQTAAGSYTPGFKDGNATTLSVLFNRPTGLAADGKGNLYIADTNNNAIRRLEPSGRVVTCTAKLNEPTGLFWKDGALYIADSGNDRICKLTGLSTGDGTGGRLTVVAGVCAGPGNEDHFLDGPASTARFFNPQGVAVAEDGSVYVADTGNSAIRVIKDGQVTTILKLDRQNLAAYPVSPRSLALNGNILYITDAFSRTLLKLPLQKEGDR